MEKEKENKTLTKENRNKLLKISYHIIFWIISILGVLFALIALLAGELIGGFIVLLGAIGINPLFHLIKMKKDKLIHHLRRTFCFILIIVGFIIAIKIDGNFHIKNNSLNNSHKEIIETLNDRLSKSGEHIDSFTEVEINEIGKENNYKIYENKIEDNFSLQLIEKDSRIEAIRICSIIENDYPNYASIETAGLVMGIIMNECGVNSDEGNLIVNELEKNNYNAEISKSNFTLVMKTDDFYVEMTMVYNTPKVKLINKINTEEINTKVGILEEKSKVKEVDETLERIKGKVESTNIYAVKYAKQDLEEYKKEIESINLTLEEYKSKKTDWQNTIAELTTIIDAKINIAVPDFNTMTSLEAENWGKQNEISVTTSSEYSDSIPNNKVISQSINIGQVIEKGGTSIKVVYSLGRRPTTGELNALKKAQSYSDNMHMSKKGLYEQLTSSYGEGFTASEAQYAIEHVQADWNYNALQKAKSYQTNLNMSKSNIYQQLISSYGESFTTSEAQYAIDHLDN